MSNSFGSLEDSNKDKIWKKNWSLKLPPKFALFLWKVVHRILPVMVVLGKRFKVEDVRCPVCEKDLETIEHLFFQCDRARRI